MRVILRPIGWNRWSGALKYKGCYDDLGPYLTRSGALYTGLTPEDEKRLGTILGVDLNRSGKNPFWINFAIRTSIGDIILDTDDPMDELKYLFLKGHKRVKTSLLENKPSADFVLINRDEEAIVENKVNRFKREAIKAFDKLSTTEMRKVLRLFGYNAENMSSEVAESKLYQLVEANPKKFMDKWVENRDRDVEVLIETAIAKNIITKNKTIYRFGSEIIGYNLQDTISYLSNPTNQDIRLSIMRSCNTEDLYLDHEVNDEQIKESLLSEISPKPKQIKSKKVEND